MASISLNNGLKALLASQYALDTIGNNIANATTPGYSRQRVQLMSGMPVLSGGVLVGGGVMASGVSRSVDPLLNARILAQLSVGGSLTAQVSRGLEVQGMFDESSGFGLGGLMSGFFANASALSASPTDSALRATLVQSASAMTSQLNSLAGNLGSLGFDVSSELSGKATEVNTQAATIAQLNVQIAQTEATGLSANDLRDQRDQALQILANLVDTTTSELSDGSVQVLVAGNMLVSPTRSFEMSVATDTSGQPQIQIEGTQGYVPVTGGEIGGLISFAQSAVPTLLANLDQLAQSLVVELNRAYSVGMPPSGPLTSTISQFALTDMDGDGNYSNELVANAGLPFDVSSGTLWVNVTEASTGAVEKQGVAFDANTTTVGDLLASLNAIDNLSASVDPQGRLQIAADSGYGFDFSSRLDPDPDPFGAFGGGGATLGTSLAGPYSLSDGDNLNFVIDVGGVPVPLSITLSAADFQDISMATADEIAAVINADVSAQSSGLVASATGGNLFVGTSATGAQAALTLTGGSAVAALGWTGDVGRLINGSDNAVGVQVSGTYTGQADETFTFRPNMDGTIGTTAELMVDVFDSNGQLVASLDVGENYQPGTALAVADGVSVTFALGDLSSTDNDMFQVQAVVDSDTTDLLVAFGINSLMTGTGAADISVRADVLADPTLLNTSLSAAAADGGVISAILALQNQSVSDLGGATLEQFYGQIVGSVGFDVATDSAALGANDSILFSLAGLQSSISGVNLDEELVELVKYQYQFSVASQFISVVDELNEDLLNLI